MAISMLGLALTSCSEASWIETSGIAVDSIPHLQGPPIAVYSPPSPDAAAIAVLVHGCCGESADMAQLALALAAEGIVAVNVPWTNHGDDAGWPRSYQDVACGVSFAFDQASTLGGDSTRVALVGWSDGALLASVVAFGGVEASPDCPYRVYSKPAVVVGLSGFYGYGLGSVGADAAASRFLGGESLPGDPHFHLGRVSDTPFLLINGEDDVLTDAARSWADELKRSDVPVASHVGPGDHFDTISPRTPLGALTVELIVDAVRRP